MKFIGILLWSLLIFLALPFIYLKSLEFRMFLYGYKLNKMSRKHAIIRKRIVDYRFVQKFIDDKSRIIFVNPRRYKEIRGKDIVTDYTEYDFVCHHFCIMDNTGNEPVICNFGNIVQFKKYFKLYMNRLNNELMEELRR